MRNVVLGTAAWSPRTATWLAMSALALWMLLWWLLGNGPLALGPHRWDDARYATRAVQGVFDAEIRNRYVHIWGLRAFYSLINDRLSATVNYACCMSLGMVAVAFAYGKRLAGPGCGLIAALLIPLYPPVLRYFAAPMTDTPSTLYAALALLAALNADTQRRAPWMALLSGLLCFASAKTKESGIAVVPAVWWTLLQHRQGARALLLWGAGAAAGQVGLCLIDLAITGNAWLSVLGKNHANYAKLVTTDPKPYSHMRNLMRHEWFELLSTCDMRSFSICALLGLAIGVRRHLTLLVLAMWAVASLLLSSWVSFRYAGIDARLRYMIMFAIPVCVCAAYFLTDLVTTAPKAFREPLDAQARLSRVLYAGGVVLALWFAYRGLHAGLLHLFKEPLDFASQRAEYFLLPLVVPAFLFIAWTTRSLILRRASVLLVVLAIAISAVPSARDYVAGHQKLMRGWHQVATYLDEHHLSKFARYRVTGGMLDAALVEWRMASLSHAGIVRQRMVTNPADVAPDEVLVVARRDRKVAMAMGFRPIAEIYQGELGYSVFDRPHR